MKSSTHELLRLDSPQSLISQQRKIVCFRGIIILFSVFIMPRCSWGTCHSDSRVPHLLANPDIKFISFVKAPPTKPWKKEQCEYEVDSCLWQTSASGATEL